MTIIMHGMNPPSQQLSADGTWFVACNHPTDKGRFCVYREWPDGRKEELAETRLRFIGGQGKLELQGNGTLWASFGEAAGTSSVGRFQIKEYVAFASSSAALDLSGMWDSVLEAKHEHDGLMWQRWNNLRATLKRNARKN